MRTRKLFIIGLGLLFILLGGCNGVTNPTAPTGTEQKVLQGNSTLSSDDTRDSDIVVRPYKTYVITAVGDSITYGTGGTSQGGYPAMLEAKLLRAGYSAIVYNEGIPGATSGGVDSYFEWMVNGADIALIMVGANDVIGDWPIDATIGHIRSMIDKSRRLGIIPILGTVTPKSESGRLTWANPTIIAVNARIMTLAAEYQIKVADTYQAILTHGGDSLFADSHHFTDQGHDVIANEFYNRIVELVFTPLPPETK
jgi:lysophospholipase L1-like esterase